MDKSFYRCLVFFLGVQPTFITTFQSSCCSSNWWSILYYMLYVIYTIYILKYYKYVNMCIYIYYNIYHIYIYIINMSIYDIQWRISVFVGKSIGHHQGTGPSLPAAAVHRTSSVASTRSKRGHPLDSAPPRFAGPRLKGFTGAKKSTGKTADPWLFCLEYHKDMYGYLG